MGMSATQARYLALTAQQTNLEYQGQQINQERTILSQQVSDLYNNLLNMQVPTPPSTQDFTKVEYSGEIGATAYSFDATTVKPTKLVINSKSTPAETPIDVAILEAGVVTNSAPTTIPAKPKTKKIKVFKRGISSTSSSLTSTPFSKSNKASFLAITIEI